MKRKGALEPFHIGIVRYHEAPGSRWKCDTLVLYELTIPFDWLVLRNLALRCPNHPANKDGTLNNYIGFQ